MPSSARKSQLGCYRTCSHNYWLAICAAILMAIRHSYGSEVITVMVLVSYDVSTISAGGEKAPTSYC